MTSWIGVLLVLGILSGFMAGLHILQQRHTIHPELSRKLVHICMGATTLSFPWIFRSPWPVVLLCVLSVALLISVRLMASLKSRFGQVLGGVERDSFGEIYFPIVVAILFFVSKGSPILYGIPMMILTFGDAAAALVGVRYGASRYAGADGMKSFEGSVALFTIAFLSVQVPLLLFTSTGRAQSLLIALVIGLLAMLIEAIAWRGLDNLFLPLGIYTLLHTFLNLTTGALITRLLAILALVLFVVGWRRHTTLKDSALLSVALTGFVCWAIGGLHWLLAPLLLFLTYPVISPRTGATLERMHNIRSVVSVVCVGLIWLFVANSTHRTNLIYPYTLSFAVQLALIGIVRSKHHKSPLSDTRTIVMTVLKSWAALFAPYLVLAANLRAALFQSVISFTIIAVMVMVFYATNPKIEERPTDTGLLIRQAGFAAAGSLLGLLALRG